MKQIKALLFDVFGTVVDWRSTLEGALKALGAKHGIEADWPRFAEQWRNAYGRETANIAQGGEDPMTIDDMNRQILEELLSSPEFSSISQHWSEEERYEITLVWHRLVGWPDSSEGLRALKKNHVIGFLSNGNVRLLVDLAKHSDLPWDVVFSTELSQTYKPNPKICLESIRYLSLSPNEVAMVAAHSFDLQAAASLGMPTIYVRRPKEDGSVAGDPRPVKSKAEGGEFDIVVDSFMELARVLDAAKRAK